MKPRTWVIVALAGAAALLLARRGPDERLERLAELEHEQWMEWSKSVASEVSAARRERWQRNWVPYRELSEEEKEKDRIWARKVLESVDRR